MILTNNGHRYHRFKVQHVASQVPCFSYTVSFSSFRDPLRELLLLTSPLYRWKKLWNREIRKLAQALYPISGRAGTWSPTAWCLFLHARLCCCFPIVQFLSHVWLCDPMDCSTPGSPVLHYLLEFAQIHVHWVSDAIQPSLSCLSPSALNLSQHQGFPIIRL